MVSCFRMLLVTVVFLFFVLAASDHVSPEALINIAHVPFPKDQLAARALRLQRDNFGLPPGLRCTSLIGPHCASQEVLDNQGTHTLSDDSSGSGSHVDVRRIAVRPHSESEKEWASLDVIIIAELGLGPAVSEEELEDARHILNVIDPLSLVEVAEKVADAAEIEDKDRFRHKFLSAFANLVAEDDDGDDEANEESDDKGEDEYVHDFFLHPARADQERNWEERREEARLDRLTKKVRDAIAEMLPHKYYDDDESDDNDDGFLDDDV